MPSHLSLVLRSIPWYMRLDRDTSGKTILCHFKWERKINVSQTPARLVHQISDLRLCFPGRLCSSGNDKRAIKFDIWSSPAGDRAKVTTDLSSKTHLSWYCFMVSLRTQAPFKRILLTNLSKYLLFFYFVKRKWTVQTFSLTYTLHNNIIHFSIVFEGTCKHWRSNNNTTYDRRPCGCDSYITCSCQRSVFGLR